MTAVRLIDLPEHCVGAQDSYEAWQADWLGFSRTLKPRRRSIRRQAEPHRIRSLYVVDRELYVVPRPRSTPLALTQWPWVMKFALFTTVLIAALALAGFPVETFRPS